MKSTGKVVGLSTDGRTTRVTLDLFRPADDLQQMTDLLDITIEPHKRKRSKNANALLWACLGELATALRADRWEVYLRMLKRYGQYTYICVKPKAVEAVKKQWREVEVLGEIEINGQKAVQLLCFYGSSTYDTKEFSTLLDGVISEMKEMGLETPLPQDVRLAIEAWNMGSR